MNEDRIRSVVSDLEAISDHALDLFGKLTAEQLNRKPSEQDWSVGQCLDHLIVINSKYFPIFEKMRHGPSVTTLLEKLSPLSAFFGRFLIKSLEPENPKKMKTSKNALPSSSGVSGRIVGLFRQHQVELADHVANISADVDPDTIITSPLAAYVTYSINDCLTMLVVHERRHLLQAKRVMESFESGV